MPRVSIVVPIYNGERFLEEALESIFAQTFRDYEVICVNDGSTDRSGRLLQKYENKLTLITQSNAGQGAARNTGVARAVGPYVAFLDQDDRWYPDKLRQQVLALDADQKAVLAHCEVDRMDAEGRITQERVSSFERPNALRSPLGRLIDEQLILPSSMLVRREFFQAVGGFDAQLMGYEDFDLCARLRLHGRFVFVEESGLCYRHHLSGFSRTGGIRVLQSQERFLMRMRALYPGDHDKEQLIHSMLAECYSNWGVAVLRSGDTREGRRMLLRSLWLNPVKTRTFLRLLRTFLPVGMRGFPVRYSPRN